MRTAVIGTGYVGLVAAACFAETGNKVWGVDSDEQKLAMLGAGKMPIYEPALTRRTRCWRAASRS
jgi:UDPglucose 6-dehydrogenase